VSAIKGDIYINIHSI